MDKREVNGEMWGRIMMGKAHNIPTYRKLTDGKMKPVAGHLVPDEVKDAFTPSEIKTVVSEPSDALTFTGVVSEPSESIDSLSERTNTFGFNGVDNDPTPIDNDDLINELQAESIHNATLFDLCQELYNRFGIYTCYLQREPNVKDIHPITGDLMNNFVLGQTRQHYMMARRNGTSWKQEVMQRVLGIREQARFDFQKHFSEHPEHFDRPALEEEAQLSMAEYRALRAKEKPIMNAERGRFDDGTDPDEVYAEPPINGRQIIRPYKTSPSAAQRLKQYREQRGQYGY